MKTQPEPGKFMEVPKEHDVTDEFGALSTGRVELEGIPGEPTKRAVSAFLKAYEKGILIRTTGDIIAMSPPLIISKSEIDQLIGTLGDVLKALE